MKDSIEGKKAIVTGASSGIGLAVTEALAKEGVDVAIISRTEEKLNDIKEELGSKYDSEIYPVPTNIRKEEDIISMVEKVKEKFGAIDIVVNNAGIIRYGDIENFSTEDYRAVMETNVDGMFFTTREVLPHLRESQGNLIFIGSFDSNNPRSFNPIYASSKWWTKGFAHSIEAIVGKEGVAVTLVNPSEVRTSIKGEKGEVYKEKFDSDEILDPEEVADVVLFAAKQDGSSTLSQVDIYRRDKLSDFF